MSAIQLRVGASLDRSTKTVFEEMIEASRRANRTIAADSARASKEEAAARRSSAREQATAITSAARAQKSATAESVRETLAAEREKIRALRDREREEKRILREMAAAQKEGIREAERMQRDADRERQKRERAAAKDTRERDRMIGGAVRGAGRFGMSIIRDLAAGAGVNLDLSSHVAANVEMERRSQEIANEAYTPGQQRVEGSTISKASFDIGSQTGTAANDVNEAIQTFVGKTGDLGTAMETMPQLAKIARATGAKLNEVTAAAADVSNKFGDIPNKAAAVNQAMLVLAGEAKIGAISFRDLPRIAPKMIAAINRVEGDPTKNIAMFGAFAQEARLRGGAGSAASAATSVAAMMATFRKPARMAAFEKAHVSLEGAGGKGRNPFEIMIDALQKTQGGSKSTKGQRDKAFGSMFADIRAETGVAGFEDVYRNTYQTTRGTDAEKNAEATKAVRKEMEKLEQTMSSGELDRSFELAMDTSASRTAIFNNELQRATSEFQTAAIPALQALTPAIKAFGEFLKNPLGTAATNPNLAFTGTVGGAIRTGETAGRTGQITEKDFAAMKKTEAALKSQVETERADLAKHKDEGVSSGKRALGVAEGLVGGMAGSISRQVSGVAKGNWGDILSLPATVYRAAYHGLKGVGDVWSAQTEEQKASLSPERSILESDERQLAQLQTQLKGVLKVHIVKDDTDKNKPDAGAGTNPGLVPHE